jgi:Ca2+-transporting ATPase
MILWINLVTDGGPALALSMDPPQEDLMSRQPRDPKEGILHGRFASIIASVVNQFLSTGVLFAVAYFIWFQGQPDALAHAQTMAFTQATIQELLIVWNCRSEKKSAFRLSFTSNKFLLFAVVVSGLLTVLVPYTGLLGTIPLNLTDWIVVLAIASTGFLILPEVFYGRKIWRWR